MTTRPDWNDIDHASRLRILRETALDQIVADYRLGDQPESAFHARLAREIALWQPQFSVGSPKEAGAPPNKEVVLGAWRDLDRSEALLELIDNSIDAWNRRRGKYPDKSAPELNIYIDIDSDTGQLSYEDNAGGVSTDKLENLVVPGHSDTDALVASIGSYKTGGKKAIFRLANAVNITTRFWNPAETGDSAVAVHLDERWLIDVNEYRFPYFELKDGGDIQRGQTKYIMQLRPEPVGAYWYSNPRELDKIARDIQNTYGLLMSRNGNINIYFPKRGKKISPALDARYDFSGASTDKVDIRPQRVEFTTELEYQEQKHKVAIEIVIGCRVTTGTRDDAGPGFDLYGNNRLFKYRDERLFYEQLPKGQAVNLARGWVNILGPNIFVPWDTHKRHLNYDREIIDLIRTHPTIKDLFENWSVAFQQISRLGAGEITKTINVSHSLLDKKTHQLNFGHSDQIPIDASKKRGQKLPADIFKPLIKATKKTKKDIGLTLSMVFTIDEARRLAAEFEISGSLDAAPTRRALSERAKEYLLGLIKIKRSKRA
jgi:Histidine kinase-, DNA gyrase B-, and HSP90-like ATPase